MPMLVTSVSKHAGDGELEEYDFLLAEHLTHVLVFGTNPSSSFQREQRIGCWSAGSPF